MSGQSDAYFQISVSGYQKFPYNFCIGKKEEKQPVKMNNFTAERNNCRRRLIFMVKQHPILWNKTQENYNRNRPQKLQTWQEISEQIGVSGK